MLITFVGLFCSAQSVQAHYRHEVKNHVVHEILVGTDLLLASGIVASHQDSLIEVGLAHVTDQQLQDILSLSHDFYRCGGVEVLRSFSDDARQWPKDDSGFALQELSMLEQEQRLLSTIPFRLNRSPLLRKSIADDLYLIQAQEILEYTSWLSSFPNRRHNRPEKNDAIFEFASRLNAIIEGHSKISTHEKSLPLATIELIDHRQTEQKSIRVRIEGKTRPNEIVILGGHIDSTVGFFSAPGLAPGADDNASGSASLAVVLNTILPAAPFDRTLEFWWYAGEEGGLIGSAEIAQSYRAQNKDVISVLQLDMVAYPGSGFGVIALINDFVSQRINQYLRELNELYIGAPITETRCGYACSDHASWFRQNYPTAMPAEARFNEINPNIHTRNDVVSAEMNFEHALKFAQLAFAYAVETASTNVRFQD